MPIRIAMPVWCQQIIDSEKNNFIIYGGRVSGKTNNTSKWLR